MNRSIIRTLVGIACSAALVTSFAGCGSDKKDDDTTGDAAALTADEFKTQANAICKAQDSAESETFTAAQTAAQAGDTEAADAAIKQGSTVIRGEADAIAALKPPAELSADVSALVTSLNDALDRLDSEGVKALEGGALNDASTKATALGLTECGN